MLNNWHKKEKPFAGFAGFGGGATGLAFAGGSGGIDATGGTKIPAEDSGNGYTYHVFILATNANFQVNSLPGDATVEILCIGGGGSGGYFYGSGGGAGGAVHSTSFPITTGTYHAYAGAGAAARPFAVGYGNGGSVILQTIIATCSTKYSQSLCDGWWWRRLSGKPRFSFSHVL